MAAEIPVVVDIEGAFQEAAQKTPKAAKPLETQVELVSKRISNAIQKMMKAASKPMESAQVNDLNQQMTRYANTVRLAAQQMMKLGQSQGALVAGKVDIQSVSQQLSVLAAKWNAMKLGSKFDPDGKLRTRSRELISSMSNLTGRTIKFGNALAAASSKAASSSSKIAANIRNVNEELSKQSGLFGTLVKRAAKYVLLFAGARFIRNVREVTAQFELQRVALGSIIQDTERANSLFKQIKAAAVQSPFEIKDLVTYTKQLSAYQIETEKLFDTTMKLADISSGLGVDMGRLILAFGQVRAAAVLRGQELRQFTEAGIPLVDKLAQKFSELNGRAVSTAEVFELISKRAVPFAMIEDIFNDLTSAGGSFYQMQQKQAETLLGQWNNLKDSVSIMYDEIGNTTVVHGAMETLIRDAKIIMQNWRQVADMVKIVGMQFVTLKITSLFLPTLTRNTKMLEKAELAEARAKRLSNAAHGNKIMEASAKSLRSYAYYTILAARATTGWSRAINSVKAFLTGNWLSLVLTAVSLITARIIAARNESQRLNKELAKISSEGAIKVDQSVRNFERLAKAAVGAADGSKEQRDAVDELVRTYGDILPPSDKVIDKLKEMEGNYTSLTDAIRQKINMQIREQEVDEIQSEFGSKLGNKQDRLKKYLKAQGLSTEEIATVMEQVRNAVKNGMISVEQGWEEQAKAIENLISKYTGRYVSLIKEQSSYLVPDASTGVFEPTKLSSTFKDYIQLYTGMENAITEVSNSMEGSIGVIGAYSREWKKLQKNIADFDGIGDTKFEINESKIKYRIEQSVDFLQKKFDAAGIDISGAIVNGIPKFNILNEVVENVKDDSARASLKSIIGDFRKEYEKLEMDDDLRNAIKSKLIDISDSTGISMDKLRSYIKAAGEDGQKYLKELGESIEKYRTNAQELSDLMSSYTPANTADNQKRIAEYNQMADALQILFDWLSKIIKLEQKSRGRGDRLRVLRQNISDITDAYKKFVELTQYKGRESALIDIDTLFPSLKGWEPTYENMLAKLGDMLTAYKGDADATRLIEQAIVNIKFDKLKNDINSSLKKLSDEIKQSEAARNFYNNILGLTGDEDLATSMTVSVYGDIGDTFKDRIQKQLNEAFKHLSDGNLTDELRNAFQNQDFKTILSNLDKFPEEWQERLKQMAESSQKFSADRMQEWLKELQAAKTYGERRVEIARKTEKRIAEINESELGSEQKSTLIAQYARKEAEDVAKLQYEVFKDSPMYVDLFSNLDAASTSMLKNMRSNLISLQGEWKNLNPKDLKELQSRLAEIDAQLSVRNPFSALIESIREYNDMREVSGKSRREAEIAASNAELNKQRQMETLEMRRENLRVARERGNSREIALAQRLFDEQKKITDEAIEQANESANIASNWKRLAGNILNAAKGLQEFSGNVDTALDGMKELADIFMSDDAKKYFDIISDGISKTVSGAAELAVGIAAASVNPIAGTAMIIKGIGDVMSGVFGTAMKTRIQRMDDEIERQGELIKDLEASYSRLNDALSEAFGNEYVRNFNQMMTLLEAKARAYQAQADAERRKGKKADEETARDYERSAQQMEDEIAKLRKDASSFFAGSDLAAAAESFADAWLSAYQEFGDTAGAIEERMEEMVRNIVKKAALSGIAQSVLGDWYSSLADIQDWNAKVVAEKWQEAMALVGPMVDGMQNFANEMSTQGQSLRKTSGQFTGISRDLAGASEESITGLAAGISTQNFYMQHIDLNVSAILATLTGGTSTAGASNTGEYVDPYKDQMLLYVGSLPQMRDEMAAIRSLLDKVIKPVGTVSSHRVIIG